MMGITGRHCVLFGVLSLARPVYAEGAEVGAAAGAAIAVAADSGDAFPGPSVQVQGAWAFRAHHAVGLLVGYQRFRGRDGPASIRSVRSEHHNAYRATAFYRLSLGAPGTAHPFFHASLGAGLWDGCLSGDYCGGGGVNFGGGGGVRVPLGDHFALDGAFETNVQTGMVNGVDMMIIPGLWLGAALRL